MKRCTKCGETKPLDQFNRVGSDGRYCQCRGCVNATQRARSPEQRRAEKLWSKYRLSVATYNRILRKQSGVCAICDSPPPENSHYQRLAVDHCHETGTVRGLLCTNCNTSIGLLGDDVKRLKRAIEYLERV